MYVQVSVNLTCFFFFQSAFAYTAVVPVNDVHNGEQSIFANGRSRGGEHNDAGRMVTVRRLRVTTVKTEASSSVKEVSSMADPYAVAAVLTHKVVSEARRRLVQALNRLLSCLATAGARWWICFRSCVKRCNL